MRKTKQKLFSLYHQPTTETWYFTDKKLLDSEYEKLVDIEMEDSECDRNTAEMRIDIDELYVNVKIKL